MVELKHYKGHEKKVIVPATFGKNRLGSVRGLLLSEHDDVTELILPEGDYEISISLQNCPALADDQGFIVIHAGNRVVLTDYIGKTDVESLSIPEGVTVISSSIFRNTKIRELFVPNSCEYIHHSAFTNCENLQRIVFSEGIKEVGQMSFYNCDSLKDIYIPASVTKIGLQRVKFRIHGTAGSEAEAFAKRENLEFVEHNSPSDMESLPDLIIENGVAEKYLGKDSVVNIVSAHLN